MFKNFLNIKSSSIISAAVVISAAGLVSRVLGLVRDRILAGQFGAGDTLDIYYAAFRLPDLIYNFIVVGALSTGFIPVFISLMKKEDGDHESNKEAWQLTNNVLNILLFCFVILGIFFIVAAPFLVPLLTPGFSAEKMKITIQVTQIMFLSPVFLGLSGIMGGVLQSFRRFLCFSLSPVMYNLGIIFGAIFLAPYWGIYGLAAGVVLGALAHFAIQLPVAIKLGYRYNWFFNFKDKHFIEIIKITAPRLLGLVGGQLNLIVITIFASSLAVGSLTIFNLSNNLQNVAIGLFSVPLAIAAFPSLSKAFADNKADDFNITLSKTIRQLIFFVVPLSILFLILRIQIVRVVLGAGEFDWNATVTTADALGIFCLSLFAQSAIPLLSRAFYARHDSMIPFWSSVISIIVNIVASWYLIRGYGILGLAFAFTISSIVNFIFLIVLLKIKLKDWAGKGLVNFLAQVSLASIIMGVATQYAKTGLGMIVDMQKFWGVFTQGLVAGLIGLLVFSIVAYWFRLDEFISFVGSIKRKLFKTIKVESEGIHESE